MIELSPVKINVIKEKANVEWVLKNPCQASHHLTQTKDTLINVQSAIITASTIDVLQGQMYQSDKVTNINISCTKQKCAVGCSRKIRGISKSAVQSFFN